MRQSGKSSVDGLPVAPPPGPVAPPTVPPTVAFTIGLKARALLAAEGGTGSPPRLLWVPRPPSQGGGVPPIPLGWVPAGPPPRVVRKRATTDNQRSVGRGHPWDQGEEGSCPAPGATAVGPAPLRRTAPPARPLRLRRRGEQRPCVGLRLLVLCAEWRTHLQLSSTFSRFCSPTYSSLFHC